jgi:hypothetical protein
MLEPVSTSPSLPSAGETSAETTPILQVDTSLLATRPAGEAVQMAPYVISEPRMKLPTPGQVLTRKGRLDVALQRRPALRFFSFWGLNNKVALAMQEEDQALERHREMNQLVSLYSIK